MSDQLRVAVIVGSTREGRFAPTVVNWLMEQAAQRTDMAFDLVDLVDVPLPVVYPEHGAPEIDAFAARLAEADAFVVVTPEYNHSAPASLKAAIDYVFVEWQAKPIGFVSYGGLAGGLRAVEHLRHVFAELHAVTIRDTVSFHGLANSFGPDGRPTDAEGANGAAKTMLDQLAWWGEALRTARRAHPYEG